MAILNAYTSVPFDRTVEEIQKMLRRVKAKKILTEYDDDGDPTAIAFQLLTILGEREFSVPCRWKEVHDRLLADPPVKLGYKGKTERHARNVAWRIVKDWLEAQLAIIESGMVAADEVFLPYMLTAPGKTIYDGFAQKRLQVKD